MNETTAGSTDLAHGFEDVRIEPDRDRYGRYLIVPAGGGKAHAYTRATTIAETLDDRYNLEAWKVRTTALGIVQRPDLYAELSSLPAPTDAAGRKKWDTACKSALEAAKGSAGANLGQALHRFTERRNRGEVVSVPAPWDADMSAYDEALSLHGFTVDPRYLERVVVLEALGVAGTFDLLLDGHIADLKTGATLDWSWGAIAVQLALYSRAETLYDLRTKTHTPMPAVDQSTGIVIHLPAGQARCTVYEVDLSAGWEAAQHALWVRGWRKRRDDLAVPRMVFGGVPTTPGVHPVEPSAPSPDSAEGDNVARRSDLIARVLALPENWRAELAAKWPRDVPTFRDSSTHTSDQLDAIDAVMTAIDWGSMEDPAPVPRPPRPVVERPAQWVHPAEGEPLDVGTVAATKAFVDRQEPAIVEQVSAWAQQAHRAGRSFSMALDPSQRRLDIIRAAFALAPYGEDVVTAALAHVLDDLAPTVGASFGSLDLAQAARLATMAGLLGESIAIIFGPNGAVRFDGPGLAAVAA